MTGAMRKVITEDHIRRIQKLKKEENLSDGAIGLRFGISASGIRHALKSHAKKAEKKEAKSV